MQKKKIKQVIREGLPRRRFSIESEAESDGDSASTESEEFFEKWEQRPEWEGEGEGEGEERNESRWSRWSEEESAWVRIEGVEIGGVGGEIL